MITLACMKLKLDTAGMEDDFFDSSRLLGIVAPVKDYLLCWQLNQVFRFNFRINNNIEIQLTNKLRSFYFTVYEYNEPHRSLAHYLYNNEHDGEYLLPEFRHLDFLWLMKGDIMDEAAVQSMISAIRQLNKVQLVTELSYDQLKNKQHLMF